MGISINKIQNYELHNYEFNRSEFSPMSVSVFGNPKLNQKTENESSPKEVDEKQQQIIISNKNQEKIEKIEAKAEICRNKLENTENIIDKIRKSKVAQMHPFAYLFKEMLGKFGKMFVDAMTKLMQSQQVQMTDKALEDKLEQISAEANTAVVKIVNLDIKAQKISRFDDKLLAYKESGGNVEDIKLDEVYEKLSKNLNDAEFEDSDDKVSEDENSTKDTKDSIDDMEKQFSEDEFSKKLDKAEEFLNGKNVDKEDADFIDEKALARRKEEQKNGGKTLFNPNKFMNLRNNSNFRV